VNQLTGIGSRQELLWMNVEREELRDWSSCLTSLVL